MLCWLMFTLNGTCHNQRIYQHTGSVINVYTLKILIYENQIQNAEVLDCTV